MATDIAIYSVRRTPISAHPAFAAMVALWFAALLGFGSLLLPVALIERIVAATGLASVLPAAAPPLGWTARAGLALGGAIVGALLGLAVARRVAQAKKPEPRLRPISVHEELGEEALPPMAFVAPEPEAEPEPQPEPLESNGITPTEAPEVPEDRPPLEELGLFQLVARLGAALETRKARLAAAAPAVTTPLSASDELAAADAAEAARAMADFFGTGRPAEEAPPAMKNPFIGQQEFVRAGEPEVRSDAAGPVVPFPSPARARTSPQPEDIARQASFPPGNPAKSTAPAPARDPREAERNLRAVLATLRRMDGAA